MKGMREIRNRIKAVKGTGQITHAMELVASSKMRKSQIAAESGRAYATLLLDIAEDVGEEFLKRADTSLIVRNADAKRLIIVISTDKGLCGALNSNLFKALLSIEGDCEFISVGSKAERFLSKIGKKLKSSYRISDKPSFAETRVIAEDALEALRKGEASSVEVLYPIFINTLKQEPSLVRLAPVADISEMVEYLRKAYKVDSGSHPEDGREISFEPSIKEIMKELPTFYFRHILHHIALDAKASEQSARMVAMKSASENAENLVEKLTLEYNKARQNAITTEITELAAAAAQGEGES